MGNNIFSIVFKKIFYDEKIYKLFAKVQLINLLSAVFQLLTLALIGLFVKNILVNETIEINIMSLSLFINSTVLNYTFISIFVINSILLLISLKRSVDLSQIIASFLRDKLYRFYLSMDYIDFIKENSNYIQAKLTIEINRAISNIILPLLLLIYRIIPLVLILSYLFYLNFKITIFLLSISIIIVSIIIMIFNNKIRKADEQIKSANLNIPKLVGESLINFKQVKIFNLSEKFLNMFKFYSEILIKYISVARVTELSIKSILEILLLCLLLVFLSRQSLDQNQILNNLPILTTYIYAAYRLLPSMQTIYGSLVMIRANKKSIEFINYIFNERSKTNNLNKNFFKINNSVKIKTIEMSNINFSYGDRYILKDLKIKLDVDKITCIYGNSGSGKTTLADILTGLLNVNNVEIKINDKNFNYKDFEYLINNKISYCTQQTSIFSESIYENITLESNFSNINNEKLNKILSICELNDVIRKTPDGLYTKLYESGQNMSGGQIQRIGLARALYKDFDIIVLDEFTSALDSYTELKIFDNLKNNYLGKKIIIIITHNDLIKEKCDNIIELK